MTKGHFHSVRRPAEIYYCLQRRRAMVMETPEGETAVEALTPGKVLYVSPRWAHRSVCTSRQEDLVIFSSTRERGPRLRTIEQRGLSQAGHRRADGVEIIDNPRWRKE